MSLKKTDLLTNLRRQHAAKKPKPARLPDSKVKAKPSYNFSKHPLYAEVKIGMAASEAIGIASPFFRQIDAVEGTRVLIGNQWVENYASYDYLGMNGTDAVRQSAAQAATQWGVSATASRLVGGERSIHRDLERELAGFMGTAAALVFVSGHATNVAIMRTLMGPGDLVMVDALAHNSIYEGIRASGAQHITFPHNDWAWLDRKLSEIRDNHKNVMIAVEGLYSMDGDAPELAQFIDVKSRHDAWLMVDEAHSAGVLGQTGRGICEEQDIEPSRVEVIMGTLSKSFCSCGGFVAGSAELIDLMRFKAPGFVYSVGLSAPNTAAALASIRLLDAEPERVAELRSLGAYFRDTALELGLDCGPNQGFAIAPIIIGDSARATWVSNQLLAQGINTLPIIAPAVPNKSARLRFFLNVGHTRETIKSTLEKTSALLERANSLGLADMKG